MPNCLKNTLRQATAAFAVLLACFSMTVQLFTEQPVQAAAYKQAYIQTTIDVSTWEILAGAITTSTSAFSTKPLEAQRMGGILTSLSKTNYPSEAAHLVHDGNTKSPGTSVANLVMVFPGNSYNGHSKRVSATDNDLARATLVRNSLIYDLNNAFKYVYGSNYEPSGNTIDEKIEQYKSDVESFLSQINGADGELNGYTFVFDGQIPNWDEKKQKRLYPDSVTRKSDYVYIYKDENVDDGQLFLFRMPKGYTEIADRGDIAAQLGLAKVSTGDTAFIHWGDFAVEAFVNFEADEKLQVTSDDVYSSTPTALEKGVTNLLGSLCDHITGALGLWNLDDLIFNGGTRGTSAYVGGIFPTTWQPKIWAFFYIFDIAALGILLYNIIFVIAKRAMATVNPIIRANAIEQIQYLFLVAIILGTLPYLFQILIHASADITGIFTDSLGDITTSSKFKSLAAKGTIGQVITYLIYLGSVIYFNVFYLFRAYMIAFLMISAPIFISMMAAGTTHRQLTVSWAKELIANIFIQPAQAFALSFILQVASSGRGIDGLITAYIMIPITHTIRALFFGNSGSMIHQVAEKGKRGGMLALGTTGAIGWGGVRAGIGGGISAVTGGGFGVGANRAGNSSKNKDDEKKKDEEENQSPNGADKNSSPTSPTPNNNSTAPADEKNQLDSAENDELAAASLEKAKASATANGISEPIKAGSPSPSSDLSNQVRNGSETGAGNTEEPVPQQLSHGTDSVNEPAQDSVTTPKPTDNESTQKETEKKESKDAAGTSTEKQAASTDSGFGRGLQIAAGVGWLTGAVALGAIGGMTDTFNRRCFGLSGDGIATQLSRVAAQKGYSNFRPSVPSNHEASNQQPNQQASQNEPPTTPPTDNSNPVSPNSESPNSIDQEPTAPFTDLAQRLAHQDEDTSSDIYNSGNASMETKGNTDIYRVSQDKTRDAGVHVSAKKNGPATIDYDLSTIGQGDAARAEAMLAIWENGSPQEQSLMQASGIQDVRGEYRNVNGTRQLERVKMDVEPKAFSQNYGIDVQSPVNGGHGITVSTPTGTAPHIAPDVSSQLTSPDAMLQTTVSSCNGVIQEQAPATPDAPPEQHIFIPQDNLQKFTEMSQQLQSCTQTQSVMPGTKKPAVEFTVDQKSRADYESAYTANISPIVQTIRKETTPVNNEQRRNEPKPIPDPEKD